MNRRLLLLSLASVFVSSTMIAQTAADLTTVAEVNGSRISLRDLQQASGEPLARLEEQVYQLKQQKLQQIIEDRLIAEEAQRRKTSVESLIDTEITSKAAEVTPEEVHRVYELNKNQVQKPEAEMEPQIRGLLRDEKISERRRLFANSLKAQAKVSLHLEPPEPFRAVVKAEGPSRGDADAPVTIVEFEDFQCPFCKKAIGAVDEIVTRYKGKVRLVHRDFPLDTLHPASMKAHEAARCAEEQGKFWQFRDLLYKNAPAASPEQLTDYATRAGLDVAAFKRCTESDKFRALVQKDESEGERLGVQGTPSFFINGRLLSGAQPAEDFARVIDEELNKRAER